MPKKVKRGVGMMERTRLQYDLTGDGGEDEWAAFIEHMKKTMVGPDEGRHQIAAGFQAILTACGLPDPGTAALNHSVYGQQGEDSVQYIAAQWSMEYHRLNRERDDLASGSKAFDLQLMIMHAEELGRLQERCQWRQGIDEATGKRPEELALSGRRQVKTAKMEMPCGATIVSSQKMGTEHSSLSTSSISESLICLGQIYRERRRKISA